jgi:C4-dicarboxylate transporter DctM subunit
MLIIACISLLALMFLGVPITFSLLGAGFLAVMLGNGSLPMYMNCRGFISGINSFTLMAIPFFMISGAIMNQGGLSKRIIQFCSALFSWLRGGVGIVCVAVNIENGSKIFF